MARPFRPQSIGPALASLKPGQIDGGLLFFHAMGLVFEEKPRDALARLEQALQTPGLLIERRTMLLFGCLLGSKTLHEWPATESAEARDRLRSSVLSWVQEAASQQDWTPREMLGLYEAAMLLEATQIAVPMAHKWQLLAPKDYRIRLAYVEALAIEGAVARADTLLQDLEANQRDADDAAKFRLNDVRRTINALKPH